MYVVEVFDKSSRRWVAVYGGEEFGQVEGEFDRISRSSPTDRFRLVSVLRYSESVKSKDDVIEKTPEPVAVPDNEG